ncbi:MAG TPA: DUF4286 family protein [Gemmatimonadaceae bacterium]|nr:DUF4286 family protein [Gemmatimonadaceae bacterium]
MITYEITARVDERLAPAYEGYMRSRHIPDLLGTGCFLSATFARGEGGEYLIRYSATDRVSLDRYLAEFAAGMRAHFNAHFPDGVELSRKVWEDLQAWP